MTLNNHGHHMAGTPTDNEPKHREVVLCDGVPYCVSCATDQGMTVNVVNGHMVVAASPRKREESLSQLEVPC